LFVFVTLAAMLCGCISWGINWFRSEYYVQLRTVDSVLAEFPQIERVWLCTNSDLTLEVERLFFSTVDRPGLILGVDWIDGASKSVIRERLRQALREQRPVRLPSNAWQHSR
jgi:hypothetical protein